MNPTRNLIRFQCRIFTLFVAIPGILSAAPGYILEEETAPERAGELKTPIEGLSLKDKVIGPPGLVGDSLGSYLPAQKNWLGETVVLIEPRTYYFRSDRNGDVLEEWAAGGRAALVTGWWEKRLRLGFSGYTSQGLSTPNGREGTGLLQPDGGSYWAAGEAFLEWKEDFGFEAKLFRMEMDLPFFNRNDSRMTPRTHEAYLFEWSSLPDLEIGAGHVSRVRGRTDTSFQSLSEAAGAPGTERGASLVGALYRIPGREQNIGILHAEGWDTFRTTYAEGTREWELPEGWILSTTSQLVVQSSIGEALTGEFDTHSFGGTADIGYGSTVATLGFTSVDEGGDIRSPWGGTPLFNSLMISDFERAGETAWRVGVSRKFDDLGLPGLSAFANYACGDTPDRGPASSPDQKEFNITIDFRPEDGALEGFWLRVRQGWNEKEDHGRREDFRVILNYSKPF